MRFFLFCLLLPLQALIADSVPLDFVVLGKETKQNYTGSGIIYFKETRLKGKAELSGYVVASKLEADAALFTGQVLLSQTTFHENVTLYGTLEAKKTTFQQKLTLTTSSAEFKECHIQAISAYPLPGTAKIAKIELSKGTIVEGSIRFEDGDGEVIISADSQVKGNILATKITRK